MNFLRDYQFQILLGCGIVCLMLSFFVIIIKFHSIRKKLALLKIEIAIGLMLIADSFGFMYDGIPGNKAYWIVRIVNFMAYMLLLGSIYFLCEYITALFMEGGKFEKLPKRLLLGFIIPSVGTTFVIINLFTGIYYAFDANNAYFRGPLYILGFLIPFFTVNMLFTFVMQYRQMINKGLLWSIIVFSLFTIVAAILQFFWYGFSFIDMVSWLSAVTLFWFALSDQNDELSKAANTEVQTGLPNTYGYMYEVDRIINFGDITQYCGFYFDIVRMSHINNKYGKKIGDETICRYAANIKKSIDKDEILGRLGGNFFVALIKKSNTEKFLNLLSDVPVEVDFEGRKDIVHIAAVAGCYEVNKRIKSSGQIMTNTATALSYAKNVVHKPYVFMDEELEKEFERIRILEEKIRKGLKADEFEPFYQPKVNTKNNVLCGAEALARWRNDGKLIPPFEFVPIMEKNGSVCELDFYILNRVCQDIKKWREDGIEPVTVSVNFSRRNLGNASLAEDISKTIEKYDIPKKYIQIEVTETIDEYPMSCLTHMVEKLQEYGITVAIDDFGTGSSSIKLLKDVKFDELKIDKSFVDYDNEKDKELLGDIIRMAKNRNISVIAEGVEEMRQVEALSTMECYAIQGYVFDKPLEKSEFDKKLINKQY